MNCPVCKRDLAPTLSICFTCGAMVHDSVREELETKISPVSGSLKINSGPLTEHRLEPISVSDFTPKKRETPAIPEPPKPLEMRIETADLLIKKTSPTLVDFQVKNSKLPDWRLQLQNSIRQRSTPQASTEPVNIRLPKRQTVTNGANALKVEQTEDTSVEQHLNPRVANALRRIEDSRRTFLRTEAPKESARPGANRNYPFNVVSRNGDITAPKPDAKPTLNPSPRPMLVSTFKFEKKQGFDTNKLPPLPKPLDEFIEPEIDKSGIFAETLVVPVKKAPVIEAVELSEENLESDEIEDLAPLPMRFNAGLFDLIIGVFLTGILMSPFIVSGGNWLSATGLLALAAAAAIVMFLYLTISLAFIGRTFGMKLFSLEMVDVEENAYPTLHQSAVNSVAFILSVAFVGLGFLPILFNEERRGIHDLLAGTIMVREY